MKDNTIKSHTIEWLRFFCIVLVVFIHAKYSPLEGNGFITRNYIVYDTIRILLSEGICRVAVPIFFFISGYLFFIKLEEWNNVIWIRKIRKRCTTLLFPYVIWNVISICYSFLTIYPKYILKTGATHEDIVTWFINLGGLRSFWDAAGGLPFNEPLWFIRDLMVIIVLTPVIYYIIKKTGIVGLIALYIPYFFSIPINWHGFSIEGLFFFALGTYFSLNSIDFTALFKKYLVAETCITVPLLITIVFTYGYYNSICKYVYHLFTLCGTITAIGVVAFLLQKQRIRVNNLLSNSSFFIYAAHGTIVLPMMVFIFWKVLPSNQIGLVILYFIAPIFTIIVLIMCYYYLSKWFPKTMSVLTGGRISKN